VKLLLVAQTAFFRSCNNSFGYLGTSGLVENTHEIDVEDPKPSCAGYAPTFGVTAGITSWPASRSRYWRSLRPIHHLYFGGIRAFGVANHRSMVLANNAMRTPAMAKMPRATGRLVTDASHPITGGPSKKPV
jgi:hypothetical protein